MLDLKAAFAKFEDEYIEFARVQGNLHPRPDLCGLLYLDRLMPAPGRDIIAVAGKDQIFLDIDTAKFAEVATEDDVLTLIRCGVLYDAEIPSLWMST